MSQDDIQAIINRIKFLDIQEEQGRKEKRQLLDKLEQRSVPRKPGSAPFQIGDRVRITNKVRRPKDTPATWTIQNEKLAIVREIDPNSDRVGLTTDNGTKTWRLEKYLAKE